MAHAEREQRFRLRAIVTAERFFVDMPTWPKGVKADKVDGKWTLPYLFQDGLVTQVRDGDWIVRDPDGFSYVYEDVDFQEAYEPVPAAASEAEARVCTMNARCLGCERAIGGSVPDSTCAKRADCALKAWNRALSPRPASEAEAEREPAPPSNLPNWEECALRVANSDKGIKRKAEGGYGVDDDVPLATELHRFIHEYDDADPYRSAWFRHRLERLVNSLAPQPAVADVLVDAKFRLAKWVPVGHPGWEQFTADYEAFEQAVRSDAQSPRPAVGEVTDYREIRKVALAVKRPNCAGSAACHDGFCEQNREVHCVCRAIANALSQPPHRAGEPEAPVFDVGPVEDAKRGLQRAIERWADSDKGSHVRNIMGFEIFEAMDVLVRRARETAATSRAGEATEAELIAEAAYRVGLQEGWDSYGGPKYNGDWWDRAKGRVMRSVSIARAVRSASPAPAGAETRKDPFSYTCDKCGGLAACWCAIPEEQRPGLKPPAGAETAADTKRLDWLESLQSVQVTEFMNFLGDDALIYRKGFSPEATLREAIDGYMAARAAEVRRDG